MLYKHFCVADEQCYVSVNWILLTFDVDKLASYRDSVSYVMRIYEMKVSFWFLNSFKVIWKIAAWRKHG